VIGPGDAFEAGGLRVHCYGEWHAPIYPDIPRVRNTGFLVDGRLFRPGDAFTDPGVPVERRTSVPSRVCHSGSDGEASRSAG